MVEEAKEAASAEADRVKAAAAAEIEQERARAQERQSWWRASSSPLEPPQVRQSPRADQKGKIMPSLVKRHEKLRAVRKKLAAKPAEKN